MSMAMAMAGGGCFFSSSNKPLTNKPKAKIKASPFLLRPHNNSFLLSSKLLTNKPTLQFTLPISCPPLKSRCSALDSDQPLPQKTEAFQQWDSVTAKFAGASNIPFLLLQLPQIILNARNLLSGNSAALFAVPWLGMFTGLLGNLSLLSYFAKKRETEVVVVQTLGVVSIYAVITQLAMAGAMPFPQFAVTSVVIACGLVINFMYYFNFLNPTIWSFWEDFITVAGVSTLPQVMWSTFVPYIPNSILPGQMAFLIAMAAVVMTVYAIFDTIFIMGHPETISLCFSTSVRQRTSDLFLPHLRWEPLRHWGNVVVVVDVDDAYIHGS